ncbi:hypothetical protein VTN00DRAFT_5619 [Thermoascus crustaceus]|uniref:uncharacterized protein n=1 Tax=Thermoascus crustaceus TaxID=5088 RepID=UPI003742118A
MEKKEWADHPQNNKFGTQGMIVASPLGLFTGGSTSERMKHENPTEKKCEALHFQYMTTTDIANPYRRHPQPDGLKKEMNTHMIPQPAELNLPSLS